MPLALRVSHCEKPVCAVSCVAHGTNPLPFKYFICDQANELLFKFEHECNYCGYRRSNESQVLKECGQEVQLKHLKNADGVFQVSHERLIHLKK